MADESPLIRVEFEHENGRIQRLTGKVAQEWLDEVNGYIHLAFVHGCKMKTYPWVWSGDSDETDD